MALYGLSDDTYTWTTTKHKNEVWYSFCTVSYKLRFHFTSTLLWLCTYFFQIRKESSVYLVYKNGCHQQASPPNWSNELLSPADLRHLTHNVQNVYQRWDPIQWIWYTKSQCFTYLVITAIQSSESLLFLYQRHTYTTLITTPPAPTHAITPTPCSCPSLWRMTTRVSCLPSAASSSKN
jgi:hypothetical protein